MKCGDAVFAKPPLEWSRETLGITVGTVRWKLEKNPIWTLECAEALARTPGEYLDDSWLCVNSTRILSLDERGQTNSTCVSR